MSKNLCAPFLQQFLIVCTVQFSSIISVSDECSYAYAKNENHAGIRHNSASGVQEQRPQVLQQNFVQTGPQNEAVPTSNQIPENLKKETKIGLFLVYIIIFQLFLTL